jgi:hypothetical protein
MKRAQAATKQGISIRTMMMMVPIIAGLSNPSLITQAGDMAHNSMQAAASAFAPDIAGYAIGVARNIGSTGAVHTSMASPVFVSGGPIYMPYNPAS